MISRKPPAPASTVTATTDVPFSDSLLLTVSVAGFCVLAATIYRIILARTGNDHHHYNGSTGDETELTLEEQLLRADVSTLNRAQRRARAKAIMKEQRRATVAARPDEDDDDNEHHDEPDAPPLLLSRRERQAAAKAKERQERMQCQAERQRQQDATEQKAQRLKQERLRAERWLAQQQRLAHEHEQEESRNQFHFMFWENSKTTTNHRQQSVEEFVESVTTKENRTVKLDEVASDFGVSVETVAERLRQLVNEGRLAGYFPNHDSNTFVAVSATELQQMADAIHARGSLTWPELPTLFEAVLNNTDVSAVDTGMGLRH